MRPSQPGCCTAAIGAGTGPVLLYTAPMTRFFRITFFAAVLFTLVMALQPHPPALPGQEMDKVQHIAAFFTLAVLGRLAFPRIPLAWLLGALALLGAAIEIAQLIPGLNRHADLADWLADIIAAAVGLVGVTLMQRLFARG